MTYKELLESVTFKDIAPFIAKYHGDDDCLVLYKMHYDMLHLMTPDIEQAYYKKADVRYHEPEEGESDALLEVFPIEGQVWEGALAMELVIAPDVKESLEEIAACCLWHTSFYGFTKEQTEETAKRWEECHNDLTEEEAECLRANESAERIKGLGGNVPSIDDLIKIPSFRKVVENNGKNIEAEYWHRIVTISDFIIRNLPSDTDIVNLPVGDLCQLYYANHFIEYKLNSYCNDECVRADYLRELIDKYNAFGYGTLDNSIVVLYSAKDSPLMLEETRLAAYIAQMGKGKSSFIYKIDDSLGRELRVNVAFYEYEKDKETCQS